MSLGWRLALLRCRKRGRYGDPGWGDAVRDKVAHWLQAIDENPNELFVFTDVDVVVVRPFVNYAVDALGGLDIVFQSELESSNEACSGFFIARGNDRVRGLFERVLDKMLKGQAHDQRALNEVLRNWKRRGVRFGLFDRDQITNPSKHLKNRTDVLREPLPFDTLRVFHANRCPLAYKLLAMRRAVQQGRRADG